jgi:glutamyl-tRNA reductase
MHLLNLFSLHWKDLSADALPLLRFDPGEEALLNRKLGSHSKIKEWLLVSTSEGFGLLVQGHPSISRFVMAQIAQIKQQPIALVQKIIQSKNGDEAIKFFAEWALGMQSPLLGDISFNKGLRSAYSKACGSGTVGPYLHRLAQWLFGAEKQIKNQTSLYKGENDTPSFAAKLVQTFVEEMKISRVALIGHGERGKAILPHLIQLPIQEIVLFSENGNICQSPIGNLKQLDVNQFSAHAHDFQLVINSLNSTHNLLHPKQPTFPPIKLQLILDLAFYGGISLEPNGLPNSLLIKMEQLMDLHNLLNAPKSTDLIKAREILVNRIEKYRNWEEQYQAMEVIRAFKLHLLKHKAHSWRCLINSESREEDQQPEDQLIETLIQDLLRNSVLRIKSAKTEQERQAYISLIAQLYLN